MEANFANQVQQQGILTLYRLSHNFYICKERFLLISAPGLSATLSTCPMCDGLFYSIPEMKHHLEHFHKKFQCEICHKLMSHKRNVDRHRRSVHENQRTFGCPMCEYRSAHKQASNWGFVTSQSRQLWVEALIFVNGFFWQINFLNLTHLLKLFPISRSIAIFLSFCIKNDRSSPKKGG